MLPDTDWASRLSLERMTRERTNPYEAPALESTRNKSEDVLPGSVDGYLIACVLVGGFGILILAMATGVFATRFGLHRAGDLIQLAFLTTIGIFWTMSGIHYFRLDRRRAQACLGVGLLVFAAMQVLPLF